MNNILIPRVKVPNKNEVIEGPSATEKTHICSRISNDVRNCFGSSFITAYLQLKKEVARINSWNEIWKDIEPGTLIASFRSGAAAVRMFKCKREQKWKSSNSEVVANEVYKLDKHLFRKTFAIWDDFGLHELKKLCDQEEVVVAIEENLVINNAYNDADAFMISEMYNEIFNGYKISQNVEKYFNNYIKFINKQQNHYADLYAERKTYTKKWQDPGVCFPMKINGKYLTIPIRDFHKWNSIHIETNRGNLVMDINNIVRTKIDYS